MVVAPASARARPVKVATAPTSARSRQKPESREPGSKGSGVKWIMALTGSSAAHRRQEGDLGGGGEDCVAADDGLVERHLDAGRRERRGQRRVFRAERPAKLR